MRLTAEPSAGSAVASSTSACAKAIRKAGANGLVTVLHSMVFVEKMVHGDERPNEPVPAVLAGCGGPGVLRSQDSADVGDISFQANAATETQPLVLEESHRGFVGRLEVEVRKFPR